ncbi:translation initiation factor eIF4e [Eremomyces bilateralis CBS 781.70]|uniref:Translation initiation factor eIF4e n=1 Tax=Eremomyces bilateralis CBS 781.70 TaxID=1392243 RepID=A0A6G1GAW8_9PEZI|nr:translation initiation factor eIF4e [Eremomyces bilateralis CBS 781.70]KAF1815215.1 translation initiation factor eIF4e [Eremomyces bilateralis CBS 781.70]
MKNLPVESESDAASTQSPARGKQMRTNLLQKLRAPPLVHGWEFWHDRQGRKKPEDTAATVEGSYEDRLVKLHTIADVREFWEVFNNFDISTLPLRDSIHLFHKGVKPLWEDPRNVKGGAWTFRVPKDKAKAFWQEISLMAIGEVLQEAVASKRTTFIDDICGISLSVRFTSMLVSIWNRDADHKEGVDGILKTVLDQLPEDLVVKESSYFYKRHSDHSGFAPKGVEQ